jgi:Zn finger protein HypA/HybF involved in hydrogenase expression
MTRIEYEQTPKTCKCCNTPLEYEKRVNSFCNSVCSATYNNKLREPRSIESRLKTSTTLKSKPKQVKPPKPVKVNVDKVYERIKIDRTQKYKDKLLSADYSTLKYESLKKRIKYEQDETCNCCGLKLWNGLPIALELEHKDGNHDNNSRDNLEMLCPNCHAQTSTWRGRNKRNQRLKITDEQLFKAIFAADMNFRQALLSVGLAAKGGNYNRCYALMREYNNVNTQESRS